MKIINFFKEHQQQIIMLISAIFIEVALIVGLFIATDILKLVFAGALLLFPSLCSILINDYLMSKKYWDFAEKEYDLAKQVSDITFEHIGSSCNHISVATDIIKERCQNMSDLAELYMSKNKSDNEYHNEVLEKIMESLEIIAKELEKKNN